MIFNNRLNHFCWLLKRGTFHVAVVAAFCVTGCDSDPTSVSQQTHEPKVAVSGSPTERESPVNYATTPRDKNPRVLVDPDCPPATAGTDSLPSSNATVRKLWLGIHAEPAPRVLLDQFDLQCGLVVKEVVKGAPSEGLLHPSDLISQFNGNDLACQKRLCAMIAESGSRACLLTVIRKTKRLDVKIVPQPIEILENGQIVQFTILADDELTGMVDMPRAEDRVAERLRMFVVQPIVLVADSDRPNVPAVDESAEQLQLERVVSFGQNERGERIMIVQEADRKLNYSSQDIKSACKEVQKLWELVEDQP